MADRRQRWLAISTLVVALLVLSVGGFALIADRQTATTIDDAVSAFRAGQATADGGATSGVTGEAGTSEGPAAANGGGGSTAQEPPSAPPSAAPAPADAGAGAQAGSAPTAPRPQQQPPPSQQGSDAGEPAAEPEERPAPTLQRPEEGVYVYDTQGGESVAFGGASHEYPEQTTITVQHSDCGYTTRWEPLEERWDQFDVCGTPERSWMRQISVYHEFYERGMTHVYACGDRSTIAAAGSRPGDRWTWECRADEGTMRNVVEVLEFGTRNVGGQGIDAVHVRIENTMTGDTEGTRVADVWFARWTGLELHGEYHVDTMVVTPMGRTRYVEDLTRTLTSLQPRR